MSLVRFDAWMEAAVSCLLENESCGGYHQKKYADLYLKVMKSVTSHISGNVREFVERWCWDDVEVK